MRSEICENVIRNILQSAIFTNNGEAKDHILKCPHAIATVVENGVLISTFYGNDYWSKK